MFLSFQPIPKYMSVTKDDIFFFLLFNETMIISLI